MVDLGAVPESRLLGCFEWFPRHFDSILGVERYRELELEAWLAGECSTPRSMVVAEAIPRAVYGEIS